MRNTETILNTGFEPLPQERSPARPLFALSDIHGHLDAFNILLDHIGRIIETDYSDTEVDLVLLGDFVDRGPDSKGVLQRAMTGLNLERVHETVLMGNHDRFLAQAAGLGHQRLSRTDRMVWLGHGGHETLRSFGLDPDSWSAQSLYDAMGPELRDFINSFKLSYHSGGIFCVHAGLDPDHLLEDQSENALLWIREPFLSSATLTSGGWPFDVTVLHGHTPGAQGVFANRIGIDSGGYSSGIFTVAEISMDGVRLHHAVL